MKPPFKGLHRVRKRLSSGKLTTYYYAWRGGPRLTSDYGTAAFVSEFAEAHRRKSRPEKGTFDEAITDYLASAKFNSLRPRTKIEYRSLIDIIRRKFGSAKLSYFNDRRTRQIVYKWRDGFADTTRKADHLIAVLSAILTYLVDQSRLDRNIVRGMDKLHVSNRSATIWTNDEIEKVCEQASDQLAWTIRLESLTGMRTGDLVRIPWSAVQQKSLDWKTSKNDVDVFIPMTKDIRSLLAEIPKVATTIVTNTKGRPWTEDGLKTMWGRAVTASGIEGKHFHDLRGTAATKFCLAGLNDNEVAAIIGWKPNRVAEIRARYVHRDVIIQGWIDQYEENKDRTETVNRGVNRVEKRNENDS
ncbi:tyrosine-type recombinase/integrase [Hyphobacterium sp.]|uniref:tyrosine-type recombinase/integrase n=1 Tax=Hyphobacterium sp. TaxID=2004662 RepID=UPI00374A28E4